LLIKIYFNLLKIVHKKYNSINKIKNKKSIKIFYPKTTFLNYKFIFQKIILKTIFYYHNGK